MGEEVYSVNVLLKALIFWGVFIILYILNKFIQNPVLALICSVKETNFEHYKTGFYSYLIVCLLEYARFQHMVPDKEPFIFSRLTAAIFLPWIIFLLWYLAPAVIGRWPNNVYEVIYANLITVLVGVFTVILEQGLETISYSSSLQAVLIALFLVSILLYVRFTFRLPWADVFVEPDWN